jgi:hypothetical protein
MSLHSAVESQQVRSHRRSAFHIPSPAPDRIP